MRNTYFSAQRAAGRRPRTEPLPDQLDLVEDQAAPSPQQVLESHELYALIGDLPAVFREALVAVDVLGLSYREAARALKTREATVTTRLYRARLRLAKALEQEERGSAARPRGEGLRPWERHYE
jgi:RNA polymerase sigma-70 factor (ECF subfamily)